MNRVLMYVCVCLEHSMPKTKLTDFKVHSENPCMLFHASPVRSKKLGYFFFSLWMLFTAPHSPNSRYGNILLRQDKKAAKLILLMQDRTGETSELQPPQSLDDTLATRSFCQAACFRRRRLHSGSSCMEKIRGR